MALPGYNFDLEESELQRRQRIAEAMQGSALAPLEMPSTPGARVSPLHIVAKAMQAWSAGKQNEGIKSERTAMSKRYGEELATGLEKFHTTSQGQQVPMMNAAGPQGPMPEPVQDGSFNVPGNRRKAVMEAIASNHPVLKDLGMESFKAMNKADTGITAKDLLPHADPSSIPGMVAGGAGAFKPKKEYKEVGGVVYDPSDMSIVQLKGTPPAQMTIGGDLYEVNPSTRQLKKLDNAPKITNTTNVNIPKAETEFMKYLGQAEGKRVSQALESRPMQIDGLAAIEKGTKLLDEGIYTGTFSDVARQVNKATGALAKQEPEKAARTEQFIAYIGDVVIPRLKDFGGSDTVEELKYLQKVQGGDTTMEASALRNVLKSADAKMRRKIEATDATIKDLEKKGLNLSSFGPGTTPGMPAALPSTPGPAAAIPLADYLKSKQGGR